MNLLYYRLLLFLTVGSALPFLVTARAATFTPLGDLPGGDFDSRASSVSADGSVVVGSGESASGPEAFRWTPGNGMVGLGDLPGGDFDSAASSVSADGGVVVGVSESASGPEAFHWTSGNGMVGLGDLPGGGFFSYAEAVSDDGRVVVGSGSGAQVSEAFRWTPGGGMAGLGFLPDADLEMGDFTLGYGVSGDGSVVVGFGSRFGVISSLIFEAFRWTSGSGMEGLGWLPDGDLDSRAWDVSADGSVVVGRNRIGSTPDGMEPELEAIRWTSEAGMVGLGDFAGGIFFSSALAVSGDGRVVVGLGTSDVGREAFVWTPTGGMRRLRDVLVANGVTGLTGWTLTYAAEISPNGQWVVGQGINPSGFEEAFLANIVERSRDVTGLADISGDTVPEIAHLTLNGQPKVQYFSGASRRKINGVTYLGPAWAAVAAATVVDANRNGVANDPAVAVLGHKATAGKHAVEVRSAISGALINKIFFLGPNWEVRDVAVIDDKNGDGVTGDTLVAVLGYGPNKAFDQQIKVEVRRLSDGARIASLFFLNGNWMPVALEGVNRLGQTPLLAVLANKPATGNNTIQARRLNNGALHRNTAFLTDAWLARDVAILKDSNGDGTTDDPAYLVLANHPETGRNKVQARRVSDGARLKNITMLGTNWEGTRITGSGDISGNLREEVGVLATKRTDSKVTIQLKDYKDRTTTATIFP